ncbi:MAG TPA: TadE family protein [Gaiellaceae bacterium]|nr:TadE family protein [Gaiellaceae bacterium]
MTRRTPQPSRIRQTEGQAAVEFALVLPVLMLILVAIFQFGIVFRDYLTLTDAVRAGTRKGAVARHLSDPSGYTKAEVKKAAVDLGSGIEVTVTSTWKPGEDVTVQATYPFKINVLGVVVKTGKLSSKTTERVE